MKISQLQCSSLSNSTYGHSNNKHFSNITLGFKLTLRNTKAQLHPDFLPLKGFIPLSQPCVDNFSLSDRCNK